MHLKFYKQHLLDWWDLYALKTLEIMKKENFLKIKIGKKLKIFGKKFL